MNLSAWEQLQLFAEGIKEKVLLCGYATNEYTIAHGLYKDLSIKVKEHRKKMKHTQVNCLISNIDQYINIL